LTAASSLSTLGHKVTVFERESLAGGMLLAEFRSIACRAKT
jgi:NADPH-dependent glutamate synthase beta subunit-like oxidoreductase